MTMPTPTFGFPRRQRILTGKDFKAVFSGSKRHRDHLFTVCARYTSQTEPRLGLAISKRHARQAVQRNRIKRCAREVFRARQHDLAAADYVVVNQPAAATADRKVLAASLNAHFDALSRRANRTTTQHNG